MLSGEAGEGRQCRPAAFVSVKTTVNLLPSADPVSQTLLPSASRDAVKEPTKQGQNFIQGKLL